MFSICIVLILITAISESSGYDVAAYRSNPAISDLVSRQGNPSKLEVIPQQCNATCTNFNAISDACDTSRCRCTSNFLNLLGQCRLCEANSPQDVAVVQLLMHDEVFQCNKVGLQVNYSLPPHPDVGALVQEIYHDGLVLRRDQLAFLIILILGGVGLLLVLIVAVCSPQVNRDPTFLNFCISGIVYSIVFSLWLYRGVSENKTLYSLLKVAPSLCLAQAAVVKGAQVMSTSSTIALVVRLWLDIHGTVYSDTVTEKPKRRRWTAAMLIALPYISFLSLSLATLFIGLQRVTDDGHSVQRAVPLNFYCTLTSPTSFVLAAHGITLALSVITVGVEIEIVWILCKHWLTFQRAVNAKNRLMSLSHLLRVILFSLYHVVVMAAFISVLMTGLSQEIPNFARFDAKSGTLPIVYSSAVWVDFAQSTIPLWGTIILGTRSDMLNAMMFWRWKSHRVLDTVEPPLGR